MKSKRKEVNKFKNKQQLTNSQQYNQEIIKRAIGVKPFQLSKIRMQKKHSEEFLNKKHALKAIADKYIISNQNIEKGNVYLDLIVQKKLLIDGQKNVKLQSQRKSLVYLVADQNNRQEDTQFLVDNLNTDQVELKNLNSQNLQAFKSQDFSNSFPKHKKCVSRCECCQQMQGFNTQAIISKNIIPKDHLSPSSQRPNSQNSQNAIDQRTQLRNIIQKTSRSPFSFTNIKWRSKSELTIVDKWKQKYEKSNASSVLNNHKSVPKILRNQLQTKQQISAKNRVVLQIMKQKQKLTLPLINKQAQPLNSLNTLQIIKQVNKLQTIIQENKRQRQKKKQFLQQMQIKINSQRSKTQNEIFPETQNNIVIKEMYKKQQPQSQIQLQQIKKAITNPQEDKQKQDTLLVMTKYQRSKNRKMKSLRSKFPEIKVSTFYSIKENDDQKKLKLHNLQKMISQSKPKLNKKIYFQKSLQQIPQRWQYGQSHEYSREEVQHYLSIKKQEELKQMAALQQQKKRQLQMQEQINLKQISQRKESIQVIQEILINKIV